MEHGSCGERLVQAVGVSYGPRTVCEGGVCVSVVCWCVCGVCVWCACVRADIVLIGKVPSRSQMWRCLQPWGACVSAVTLFSMNCFLGVHILSFEDSSVKQSDDNRFECFWVDWRFYCRLCVCVKQCPEELHTRGLEG